LSPPFQFDINRSAVSHDATANSMFFIPYRADVTGDSRADFRTEAAETPI